MVNVFETDFIGSFVRRYPQRVIEILLCDRTTGKNIIWADKEYDEHGDGFSAEDEITIARITGDHAGIIRPRVAKDTEKQAMRTKTRAEVFTPSWLVNRMNNYFDNEWFGKTGVFNTEIENTWEPSVGIIAFPKIKNHGWHAYIRSTRLEITCGEAPFICSRYDPSTGEGIPVEKRIGILDRKLRVISDRSKTINSWVTGARIALQATYGYEYQGDNLLIARINVFETLVEHCVSKWGKGLTQKEMEEFAQIISWNFWQMDGLSFVPPTNAIDNFELLHTYSTLEEDTKQIFDETWDAVFTEFDEKQLKSKQSNTAIQSCIIYDWEHDKPIEFVALKGGNGAMKKFYAVIGNPPYQEEGNGNKNYAPPIYHKFMDAAYEIGEKVELITPARFLFNAGSTPKVWNDKMLNDEHFKILDYYQVSSDVFPDTDIKGGVAVSLYDTDSHFEPIRIFTTFKELNSIVHKVQVSGFKQSLSMLISGRGVYRLSDLALEEHPELYDIQSTGHHKDVGAGAFKKLKQIIFFEEKPSDGFQYVQFLGLESNSRVFYWTRKDYQDVPESFYKYKVFIPKANGSGALGEVLSTPLIGAPLIGATETFLSIGSFDDKSSAEACLKYVKTKFARVLLGVLKITQDNTRGKWEYVPLQDFTSSSDIDWSQSIAQIDQQLYRKYGLNDEEIEFIESHVKEMN